MTTHTIETVRKRLDKVGVTDTFFTKREIKELPYVLRESEEIMYATSGSVENNTVFIVCTNERVIFLDKGMIYGLKQHEVPLDKINSVSISKGLILGSFVIYHGAAAIEVKNVDKKTLPVLADTINEQIHIMKNKEALQTNNTVPEIDTTGNMNNVVCNL